MAPEWTLRTVRDIAVTNTDTYSPRENWDYVNYLDTGNITNGAIDSIQQFSADDKLPSRARRKVMEGDIVYSTVRPNQRHYGIISEPEENMLVSTGFTVIRGSRDVCDTVFLYYFLTQDTIVEKLQTIGEHSTSAYPSIKPSDIESLEIYLPPLDEQKAIAHILGTLDDKIELNRQMNATLEAMAQALFKSWFVDFDPVIDNALAAGNPIPEPLQARAHARKTLTQTLSQGERASTLPSPSGRGAGGEGALPAAIQQQFPSRFVFNDELGWVPEGWESVVSGQVIDVRDGTHDSPKQSETGYPLVTSKHITSGKLRLDDAYLISKSDYEQVNQRSKVEHGDILLTMIGTVGIPYLVMPQKVDFAIKNVGLFRTSQTKLYRFFFFLLLRSQGMKRYLDARMAGTTQKYLSLKVLRNIEFLSPRGELLSAFNTELEPLMCQIQQREEEVETLGKIRDTLLPKLLSGQLRIPAAEKLIESVQ